MHLSSFPPHLIPSIPALWETPASSLSKPQAGSPHCCDHPVWSGWLQELLTDIKFLAWPPQSQLSIHHPGICGMSDHVTIWANALSNSPLPEDECHNAANAPRPCLGSSDPSSAPWLGPAHPLRLVLKAPEALLPRAHRPFLRVENSALPSSHTYAQLGSLPPPRVSSSCLLGSPPQHGLVFPFFLCSPNPLQRTSKLQKTLQNLFCLGKISWLLWRFVISLMVLSHVRNKKLANYWGLMYVNKVSLALSHALWFMHCLWLTVEL